MNSRTWIVYKAEDADAEGWFDRRLMPGGGLTDVLEENWDWSSHPLPEIGSRTRDYENLSDPGNGATHGKDGDWVVIRIQQFLDPDSSDRIVVCYCAYRPIEAAWQELKQGAPVDEMLAASK